MFPYALEPDYYAEPDDYVHRDDIKCYEGAKEWIEGIIECIYKTGDMEQLEYTLEELAAIWGMSIPPTEPLLQKKSHSGERIRNFPWINLADALSKAQAKNII